MRSKLNHSGGLVAAMLMLLGIVLGCQPADNSSATLVVPDGMESAVFSVSGMV